MQIFIIILLIALAYGLFTKIKGVFSSAANVAGSAAKSIFGSYTFRISLFAAIVGFGCLLLLYLTDWGLFGFLFKLSAVVSVIVVLADIASRLLGIDL